MGRGRGEGLSAAHLAAEHVLTLGRGDAVFQGLCPSDRRS
jgi:hypothetical protein